MSHQPYPVNDSRKEIVFIRHAETQANREGVWHGREDGELSARGEESLEALGRRLSTWNFDAVLTSPLTRARRTAQSFASDVVVDEDLIEMDMGEWEGKAASEVLEVDGDYLQRALAERNLPMGRTGETLEGLAKRARGAIERIYSKMSSGQRVAVVTHGGFMQAVLHRHMAGDGHRVHAFTANTGITRIVDQWGRLRLASFNDTGHLGPQPESAREHLESGTPVFALIRHGRTRANVEGRWQGHGDWDLDEVGQRQAELLGEWYGRHQTVYSSPLKRASSTAKRVASNGVVEVEGLKEINMGEWEGLTTTEIAERWPDVMKTIYEEGEDLPRGFTGESWSQLTERVASTLSTLEPAERATTVAVAHGGAIRSYISSLTKTNDSHAESFLTPANTSITHVAMTDRGPEILDYSVAPHLESAAR